MFIKYYYRTWDSWLIIVQVGSVNFSSTFDPKSDAEEPAECTTFYTNMVSIVCNENILSADLDTRNKVGKTSNQSDLCDNLFYVQLEGPLRKLWFPTPDRATAYETSFVVIGPIPNDNPGHITTGLEWMFTWFIFISAYNVNKIKSY